MDSPSSSLDQNIDLSKLSDKDKQELQQFVVNESQKARIQQSLSPSPSPSLFLKSYPGVLWKIKANGLFYSCTQLNRDLLQEMRNGQYPQRETGEGRGELRAELCGSVFGCKFYGY
jgi:hypothetical protein